MEDEYDSENDYLNFAQDKDIMTNIVRNEIIQYSDKIKKINNIGWSQERNLLITNEGIYNLKGKVLKRRIDIKAIKGITFSSVSDEFVVHCNDVEYDYHYLAPSSKKKIIIGKIAKLYYNLNGSEIKLVELSVKSLGTYVTSKKEKEKDKNKSRMPQDNFISVSEYIYGTKGKVIAQKREATVSKTGKIYTNTNVSMNDFQIIKTIGRGSVGKVSLVKYKKTGDYYAIKSMRKDQIISENIIDNISKEKDVLSDGQCQFLLSLSFFFQSPERIYFVTPYMIGGDLYNKLQREGIIEENVVKFYTGQIAIALAHLHEFGTAYRDLKPENILIDVDGYIKLCDFGACVHFQGSKKENTFAGSPEYASPEMITYEGHTIMSDWWSFGILIYELLYGITPFFSRDKNRMYELIAEGEIKFPKTVKINNDVKVVKVSEEAKNIIQKLLIKDPESRLGKNELKEIQSHPFFGNLNFEHLKKKKLNAPFKPTIDDENPTINFDKDFTDMDTNESPVADWISDYQEWFNDFEKGSDE